MLDSILPTPLHPAVVHLPIALAALLPPFAIGALVAIRRGARPMVAWGVVTALFAALSLTSWVAVETGEQADEQVESVVAERPIESHEEAAEVFLLASVAVAGIAAAGLMRGRVGQAARLAGTAGSLALLGAGWQVGHSGGELVYRYGAASAYTAPGSAESAVLHGAAVPAEKATASSARERRTDDDSEHDDHTEQEDDQ